MAKAYYLTANVIIAGGVDTWASWVDKFNTMTFDMGSIVVTTDSTSNGALTSGNAYVNGIFTANTLSSLNALSAGASFSVGNATVNISCNSTVFVIGNSTVNLTMNSTTFTGTGAVSNATNLNGHPGSFYTNATNITTGLLPTAQLGSGTANSTTYLRGDETWALIASPNTTPGGVNTSIQFNDSSALGGNASYTFNKSTVTVSLGNSTVNTTVNSTVFSGTANNATNLGGTAAAGYQTTGGLSANVATLTANNSTNFNGQPASFYTNATNITTGTLPNAQLSGAVVNTSASFTFSGAETFNANITLVGNATSILTIGNSTVNSTHNSSIFALGNSTVNTTVNSTVFSGTANNATNLGGAAASAYVNTSGSFSLGGTITFNSSPFINGQSLGVGNSTVNASISSSLISIGSSTVNTHITSTDIAFSQVNAPTSQYSVGFRGLPASGHVANYAATTTDNGTVMIWYGSGPGTFVIQNTASTTYLSGTVFTILNATGFAVNITPQTGTTLLWCGTGQTGGRTLGTFGIATLIMNGGDGTNFFITGAGLS